MSNTAPANNLGSLNIPPYDAFGASSTIVSTSNSGAVKTPASTDTTVWSPCATHKAAWNAAKFPSLNNVSANQKIWAAEINSLKWAIRNVSQFWNQSGNGQLVTTTPTFTTKVSGDIITSNEWNEIKTALAGFVGVQGASALTYKGTSDRISASFHNDLKIVYDAIRSTCRCNSDCGCNLVCTCNYNCGCNYSDRRLKTNIVPITGTDASDRLYDMNTYAYNYSQDNTLNLPESLQYGVMAQDLIELGYHEFINKDTSGLLQVNYGMMIPLMINELQKQKQNETKLMDRLDKLEKLVNQINNDCKSW
jgi:hypothetical protein